MGLLGFDFPTHAALPLIFLADRLDWRKTLPSLPNNKIKWYNVLIWFSEWRLFGFSVKFVAIQLTFDSNNKSEDGCLWTRRPDLMIAECFPKREMEEEKHEMFLECLQI